MYSQIASNKRKTVVIMVLFVIVLSVLAYGFSAYFGDPSITYFVLVFAIAYATFSYFNASKMALAVNGAHPIEQKDNPRVYRTVENLAITNGMPMPKVYMIDDPAPNAFASGRDPKHSVVAVTTGLDEMMSNAELEGVLAHELGHVKNYDIRVSMIAFALVTIIALLSDILLRSMFWGRRGRDENNGNQVLIIIGIVAAILAPIAAALLQMAISRKREYLADATGALTTRYPEGLASALKKIGASNKPMKRQNTATAHLFFANPLKGKKVSKWFSTHPPVEDRIKRLNEMGSEL